MNVVEQLARVDHIARQQCTESRLVSARSASAPSSGDVAAYVTSAALRRETGYSFDALHCAAEPQAIRRAVDGSNLYKRIFALPFELRATIFRFATADLSTFEASCRGIPLAGDVRATRKAVKDAMETIPAGNEGYAARKLALRLDMVAHEIPRADAIATLVQQSALRPMPRTLRFAKNFAVDSVAGFTTEPIRQIVLNSVLDNLHISRSFGERPALQNLDALRSDDELFTEILEKCGTMRHSLIRTELLKRLLKKVQRAELGPDRKQLVFDRLHACAEGIKLDYYRRPLQDSIMRYLATTRAA